MDAIRLLTLTLFLMPMASFAAQPTPAETAAKTALDGYAEAINKQSLEALGGYWSEAAEHIDDEGTTTSGKAKLVEMFKKIFADNPKLTVKFKVTSARMLGNEVLLVDGVAEIKNGEASDVSQFESLWLKSGTSWQISRVRELASADAGSDSNYDRLKELEWLVGDWTSESDKYSLALTVKWTKNRNFLFVEQTVSLAGKEVVTVTKIVGWDPSRTSLRTWVFDSDGGFGGGLITRNGNAWSEAGESLTRNGGEATALHTLKFSDANAFEWTSTGRTLDDAPQPDLKVKYTRKTTTK